MELNLQMVDAAGQPGVEQPFEQLVLAALDVYLDEVDLIDAQAGQDLGYITQLDQLRGRFLAEGRRRVA